MERKNIMQDGTPYSFASGPVDNGYKLPVGSRLAVGWLKEELEKFGDPQMCELSWKQLDKLIEQAEEIEKENLNIARIDGINLANKGYEKK